MYNLKFDKETGRFYRYSEFVDDVKFEIYIEKLTNLFQLNDLQSIEVPIMEVPCCSGLVHIVRSALAASGKKIPLTISVIGVRGDLGETTEF